MKRRRRFAVLFVPGAAQKVVRLTMKEMINAFAKALHFLLGMVVLAYGALSINTSPVIGLGLIAGGIAAIVFGFFIKARLISTGIFVLLGLFVLYRGCIWIGGEIARNFR